ncbi:MAG TPA: CopG family transcriptional regulator [Aquificales bacterium]|nr:CopG family transcriptional regulator [Aquificales bacterium]
MGRQSITFTKKNDDWLKSQVDSDEFTSKSELINSLVRQARGQEVKVDWIRTKLIKGENSGFTSKNKEEILSLSKQMLENKL